MSPVRWRAAWLCQAWVQGQSHFKRVQSQPERRNAVHQLPPLLPPWLWLQAAVVREATLRCGGRVRRQESVNVKFGSQGPLSVRGRAPLFHCRCTAICKLAAKLPAAAWPANHSTMDGCSAAGCCHMADSVADCAGGCAAGRHLHIRLQKWMALRLMPVQVRNCSAAAGARHAARLMLAVPAFR